MSDTANLEKIERRAGRAVPVRGDDLDTDRVIPARFMKCVTFDGLEQYVFHDVRFDENGNATDHAFNQERFQGACILVVNRNFGCGSSREHAPQSLMRWGVTAIIGESFAEIFLANCGALGVPAVQLSGEEIEKLQSAIEAHPEREVLVDVDRREVRYGDHVVACDIGDGARRQLLEGTWDAARTLLTHRDGIDATAARLPYMSGF